MLRKLILLLILTNISISASTFNWVSAEDSTWWNSNWSSRQEIEIPIDTNSENARFQPIDIHIDFEKQCWAKNEKESSVRVIYQNNQEMRELECQIYDLDTIDECHIKSCNLVFLIPEQANGKERYYIYYDNEETNKPNYEDHIQVEEASYYFAPIPGYPFSSYYYKITQDGFVVYAVASGGEFLGLNTIQQVTILAEKTKEVSTPKDALAWASFDYFYYHGGKLEEFYSTFQKLVSKNVFIDGNLMVEFAIVSETPVGDFRTTATYKYYYCPDYESRRIYANVKHEALKESQVTNIEPASDASGNIASFQVGSVKSPSIDELNFGRMFPYMHIYSENNKILEYPQDMDIEYIAEGVRILDTKDDIDLGEKAWVSYDDGKTGVAHALIFDSNSVVVSGTDERDGIQIKALEAAGPGLLGLETDIASYTCVRNSYEKGSEDDLKIPSDFVVEYDAEFFSTKNGYLAVDKESELFQILIKNRPSQQRDSSVKTKKEDTYNLTAFIHTAPSAPMGSPLSLVTGHKFSYIIAELYKNESKIKNDIGERISINSLPNLQGLKPLKKIIAVVKMFDWRNASFFKKILFPDVERGRYIIKIYRENPFFGKERKYIGFKIIDINSDTKTHIFCKIQGSAKVTVTDQHGSNVEDAYVRLLSDNMVISEGKTNSNSSIQIYAPCSIREKYNLQLIYNGFLVYEKTINLNSLRSLFPLKIIRKVELYTLTVNIRDTLGNTPYFDVVPVLTSKDMIESTVINAKQIEDGQFIFENIYPAQYTLHIQYQSFVLEKNITIPMENNDELNLILPTEFEVSFTIYDIRGIPAKATKIVLQRDGKTIELKNSENDSFYCSLPAGFYTAKVHLDNKIIGKRSIEVISKRKFDLLTNQETAFPQIVIASSFIIFAICAIFIGRKKDVNTILKLLAVALIIFAVVLPWWGIQGYSREPAVKTATQIYLVPSNLVSLIITPDVIAGEYTPASFSVAFTVVVDILLISMIMGAFLIVLNIMFCRKNKQTSSIAVISMAVILLVATLCLFCFAMSIMTKVGVGSFLGEGMLNTTIPGQYNTVKVSAQWGPSFGFYSCLLAAILISILSIFEIKKFIKEKPKKKNKFFDKKNIIKIIKKLMPLIGIVLLAYLIFSIGTDKIASTFLKISPVYVLLSVVLVIPRLLVRNTAWQIILKKQNIAINYFTSLKVFLAGYFYGAVTPGYIGQLMRIPYLKEKTKQPVGKLFINTIIEEAVHTLPIYIFMIIGAFLIAEKIPQALPIAFLVLSANVLIYIYFLKRERGEKTLKFLIKILIPKKLKPYFIRFVSTFYEDFPGLKYLIIPFILSIPEWILIYSQIYVLGIPLGIEVPYFDFLMLYAIANILSFIPITSAGLGVREGALVILFGFYGVAPEKAVVLSLAGHMVSDVLTGFYGFIISVVEAKNNKKKISSLEEIFEQK